MRAAALLLGCVAILVVSMSIGGVVATDHGTEESLAEPTLVYDISIQVNGDAHWEIRATFPIDSESDEDAFEELAVIFEEDEGDTYLPIEPYEIAASELGDALDRSMAIRSEDRYVERTNETGTLAISFEWSNFAVADTDQVVVGDVFATDRMTWFVRLESNERLAIHAPGNYTVSDSGLPVQDRAMYAEGPRELQPRDLQGTFVAPGSSSFVSPFMGSVIGLAALAALIAIVSVATGRGPFGGAAEEDSVGVTNEEGEVDEREASESVVNDTLLSDEERVLALIENRDGRMKQADIVAETDWSNAKVSQLLSQMADDGQIEKLRIGRENLIRVPDDE